MNVFRLDGETALITGGGSGIGLGIARCLAAAGAKVVLVGRRREVLEQAHAEIGARADIEVQDICRFEELPAMLERVTSRVGRISILVNNAGNHLKKPAEQTTDVEFGAVLHTHVHAAFALTRTVLPDMLEAGRGNILFTASMASFMGVPLIIAYSAAKSAYLGMVRSLASEVSERGVRVNAIAPGWIDSPVFRQAVSNDPVRLQKILGRTPMGRLGSPEEIGWSAVYLCSRAAGFVTGTVLPVDGGASIGF